MENYENISLLMQNIPSALKPILISTIQKMGKYWRTSPISGFIYATYLAIIFDTRVADTEKVRDINIVLKF